MSDRRESSQNDDSEKIFFVNFDNNSRFQLNRSKHFLAVYIKIDLYITIRSDIIAGL